MYPALQALVAFQRVVPGPLGAEPTNHALPVRTPNDLTVDPQPTAHAADPVPVMTETVDPEDVRPEPRERLRVGVTTRPQSPVPTQAHGPDKKPQNTAREPQGK